MSELLDNTAVIIRSSGERTEGLCRYAIEQNGVPKENIHLIKNEKPFSQALKKGYELALELDKPYTFFVDADMVVMKNSLDTIVTAMDRLPDDTFSMSVLAYDYCMGAIVPQGPHLYRTKHLEKAIEKIPMEDTTKRPETSTKKSMYETGYQLVYLEFLAAYHEFEQYYRDIFGRTINKMKKTGPARAIKKNLAIQKTAGRDFYVMNKAIEFAENNQTQFRLLAGEFDEVFSNYCNIAEKEPIHEKEFETILVQMQEDAAAFRLKGYTSQLLREESEEKGIRKRIGHFFKNKF